MSVNLKRVYSEEFLRTETCWGGDGSGPDQGPLSKNDMDLKRTLTYFQCRQVHSLLFRTYYLGVPPVRSPFSTTVTEFYHTAAV